MNDAKVIVRSMDDGEFLLWGTLRTKLWPDCPESENEMEYAALRDGTSPKKIVFLAFAGDDAIGFAEISERSVADGCGPDPTAYLEGWYVEPQYRGSGVGSALIAAAIAWGRQQGYQYLGSDVETHNLISQKAHEKLGFVESGRVVNYHMKLAQ